MIALVWTGTRREKASGGQQQQEGEGAREGSKGQEGRKQHGAGRWAHAALTVSRGGFRITRGRIPQCNMRTVAMRKSEDRSLAVTTLHTTGMTTGPSQDTTRYPEGGTRKLTGPEGPKGPTEGAGRTRGDAARRKRANPKQPQTTQTKNAQNNRGRNKQHPPKAKTHPQHHRTPTGKHTNQTTTDTPGQTELFFRPTPDGSRQVVYQAGKTIALCKFTELMQWKHWP